MLNFQMYEKVKVVFGKGSINQLGELATHIGSTKALIVADAGMVATGTVDKVKQGLENENIPYVVYDKVTPNPPIAAVEEAYEILVKEGCDMVIGVGGGSNMDAAKGINILRFNEAPIIQYANGAKHFECGTGLIMIPTTAGTGSEMSDGSILSDENHIKQNFISDQGPFAEYAIVDPELMAGMPPKLTASTGIDALAHAVESYTGNLTNAFIQFYSEKIIDIIAEYLPRAVENGQDMVAREKMAVAAAEAGFLLCYGHTHAGHSIGQTVGGYFNIPHGTACSYALPLVLEFNAPAVPELTKNVGKAFGAQFKGDETPEEIGRLTKEALNDFVYNKCKMPSIKTFEYDESKFEEIAQAISEEFFQTFNPRKMTAEDALKILKEMYA